MNLNASSFRELFRPFIQKERLFAAVSEGKVSEVRKEFKSWLISNEPDLKQIFPQKWSLSRRWKFHTEAFQALIGQASLAVGIHTRLDPKRHATIEDWYRNRVRNLTYSRKEEERRKAKAETAFSHQNYGGIAADGDDLVVVAPYSSNPAVVVETRLRKDEILRITANAVASYTCRPLDATPKSLVIDRRRKAILAIWSRTGILLGPTEISRKLGIPTETAKHDCRELRRYLWNEYSRHGCQPGT